ncbi:MAG: V-type ATPase 116kDa subunit family protein [Pseudoflavonifractor sp.]
MKLMTIAGPLVDFDAVVRACIINQPFHPESALQFMGGTKGLRPFDLANPYSAPLRRAEQVADAVGIPLEYSSFTDDCGDPADAQAYFDALESRVEELKTRHAALLQSASDQQEIAAQVQNLEGVTTNLEDLWALDYARFRYGYLPRETYDSFRQSIEDDEDLLFFPTNLGQKLVYGVYFTTKYVHHKADSFFNSLHFVRIHVDEHASGSAGEAMAALNAAALQAQTEAQQVLADLEELKTAEHHKLMAYYSYLRYQNDAHDLRRFAAWSHDSFYLMGWVPEPDVPGLQAKFGAFPALSCVVDNAGDLPAAKPPTKLKGGFLGRAFAPFMEMYGLPAYNELDPSLFMAITYCLFFGMMFGDIGQGLCLALVGFVLAKWKHMWLGNIITCCGLSGAVFGCIYGSLFGIEILPEQTFKILGERMAVPGVSNVLLLLVISIALGVCMLAFVIILNMINGIHQKNYEKIFFGPNGLAGMTFYIGLIVAAVVTLLFGVNLFTAAYILPVLVLPLVLILFKEPLALLLSGDPAWKRVKLGDLLVTGFFELFETLLSYLTNTLSFMRIGAYAITHVGLMLVVEMLANMAGGLPSVGGIVAMVCGNIFVMGFEGLLVGIQVLRLEFYELFGRFYDDGGTPFVPKTIDYSAHAA